ncbi:uncharacterized protein LOC128680723 isoform X2 [Plodia interpunctella]|uniref:uncharacterized protein LOC128680723 isoform X2 n=1 Tax=Plodia interpunctella TaxID=58824 RepID=UPI0023682037|nr:uncharacterized protein LOC128680723 isoform X2 [Plodia interpunctella]
MEVKIRVHPTPRPWPWPGWDARHQFLDRYNRRRFRLTLQDLARFSLHDSGGLDVDWHPLPGQGFAVSHIARLNAAGQRSTGDSYQEGSWPPATPPAGAGKGFGLFGGDDWKLPDLKHLRLEPIPMAPAGINLDRRYNHWETARAWAGALLVLVALVLLVRALEKCMHCKLFKNRRRQSQEWPTPNVLATSHRHGNDLDVTLTPRMENSQGFQSESNQDTTSNDLPPPYSECAIGEETANNKFIAPEDPPPPYSACYVTYSNPRDGVPSVHFLNRQSTFLNRLDTGQCSSTPDVDIQNADNSAKENDGCDNSKTELVFENGRVIERENVDLNENNTQRNINIECVVNISESGLTNVPDRLSLQV